LNGNRGNPHVRQAFGRFATRAVVPRWSPPATSGHEAFDAQTAAPCDLGTYAHVMDELRGAPQRSAELIVAAREQIEKRGLGPVLAETVGP
jgi:hypothetical protein